MSESVAELVLVTKRCSKCGETKSSDGFSKHRNRYDGMAVYCKSCTSAYGSEYAKRPGPKKLNAERALARYHALPVDEKVLIQRRAHSSGKSLQSKYGIDSDGYAEILARQGGQCAICGRPPSQGRRLSVDHDHACCQGTKTCGKCIRGLLCVTCNVWVGVLESGEWRAKAEMYLFEPEQSKEKTA